MTRVFIVEGRWIERESGSANIYYGHYVPAENYVEAPEILHIGVEPGNLDPNHRATPPYKRHIELYLPVGWEQIDVTNLSEGKRFFIDKRPSYCGGSSLLLEHYKSSPTYFSFVKETSGEFRHFLPEFLAMMGVPNSDLVLTLQLVLERFPPSQE